MPVYEEPVGPELAPFKVARGERLTLERLDFLLWLEQLKAEIWKPNPGPQTEAYESQADILGYGGAGGGGKTDLALGLAINKHTKSVIFRRVFPNLRDVIARSHELLGPLDEARYNESKHRWVIKPDQVIEFEACQFEKDKFKQRGRPRDLYVFDEATEMPLSFIQFITGWLRTTKKGQRTRIVFTFNPPMQDSSEGMWVVEYFRPWLAFLHPESISHPNPAEPGELRWYATVAGREVECDGPAPFQTEEGEIIYPMSRTFIPAKLEDNPYLADSGYRARLQGLPEPLRSQLLYGDFSAKGETNLWQVIPSDWVRQAQQRWTEMEKPDMPVSGVGVDLVRGGADSFALAKRYGRWFDEVLTIPGVDVEDGPAAAGLVAEALRGEIVGYINMDVIGIGSSGYDSTKAIYPDITNGVNAAAGSDYVYEDDDGNPIFRMANKRAEYHWKLREALDPEGERPIALPPGHQIFAELTSMTYKLKAGGIGASRIPAVAIEPKEDIKKRLGKSPDVAEAIMLANLVEEEDYVMAVKYA